MNSNSPWLTSNQSGSASLRKQPLPRNYSYVLQVSFGTASLFLATNIIAWTGIAIKISGIVTEMTSKAKGLIEFLQLSRHLRKGFRSVNFSNQSSVLQDISLKLINVPETVHQKKTVPVCPNIFMHCSRSPVVIYMEWPYEINGNPSCHMHTNIGPDSGLAVIIRVWSTKLVVQLWIDIFLQ